jgi:hypothetical protein
MTEAYADLARDIPPGDMYDVEYTEPVKLELPPSHNELEGLLQDFSSRLLLLRVALRNLHLSYERFWATNVALEQNRGDPVNVCRKSYENGSGRPISTHWTG